MAYSEAKLGISVDYSRNDPVACSKPVQWALRQLARSLRDRGLPVNEAAEQAEVRIRAAGAEDPDAKQMVFRSGGDLPAEVESFSLVKSVLGDGTAQIFAVGADERGLVYALLELADRMQCADDPLKALAALDSIFERPSTPIRSVTRLFVSEIEDKPWFYDKTFWDEYLTELATHRFNRFSLALGIGYDSGHDPNVRDNYFCFAYPFFLQVPGYSVRAANLPESEAERNLEMLRYIGEQAKLRGLHFQLGLWTHSYAFPDSPDLRYPIEGVTPHNHAAYCRDALKALSEACPSIDGITLRVHYESGIPEPALDFWRVVMQGAQRDGKRIEIDMHSKGVDDELIETALQSGSPILVSAKYWAEHLGLPYHQADIRPMEKPRYGPTKLGFDAVTAATRRFTRYGYGDFLKEDRKYGTIFRVWPGTQRLLLWGDPAIAAGYGRFGAFCGSQGIEWFDPLSFKARKDSGTVGGRDPYVDASMQLAGYEWKKYRYTYRLWGRLMYNPQANPEDWRRYLCRLFGDAALACEEALAYASRILPLVTVAYHPSAANNLYWPEMYSNQSIAIKGESYYSFDTPDPKTFGAASPLDPQLFYRIDDFADDLLRGERSGKYSPLEVADRLDTMSLSAEQQMKEALDRISDHNRNTPEFGRFYNDVAALIHIGQFFAGKFRAGLSYALFERTRDPEHLRTALEQYRSARAAWGRLVEATAVYKENIAFGFMPYAQGHWSDRLTDIDLDISAMEHEYELVKTLPADSSGRQTVAAALYSGVHPNPNSLPGSSVIVEHTPPSALLRGKPLKINCEIPDAQQELRVDLIYRHANQAEAYQAAQMNSDGCHHQALIPAEYTETLYPIVYYFEIKERSGNARIWPGLDASLSNQPYFVVRPTD